MRLRNIDFFKGFLIVLVIIGHMILEDIDDSFWRSMIYSFHMPLFIGISGFLFNADKLIKLNFIELVKKYQFRVLIPWIIAVLGYYLINSYTSQGFVFSGFEIVKAIVYPFYHLWFIPAFMSWVIFTWWFWKSKKSVRSLLLFTIIISFITIIFRYYPTLYQWNSTLEAGVKFVLHTFRPYFYFFFVIGFLFKNLTIKKPKKMDYILLLVGLLISVILYFNPIKGLSIFNFYFLNIVLLALVLELASNNMVGEVKSMEWLGVNSLAIYLWHVLPILIASYLFGEKDPWLYYGAAVVLLLVFIVLYKFLLRFIFFKKYVFGVSSS